MLTTDEKKMPEFTQDYWFEAWNRSITEEAGRFARGHSTVEFWDNMSKDYDKHYDEESLRLIDESIADLERRDFFSPGMKVLDIGCGTGRMAIAMAKRGAEVTALDFSGEMLERLRANCGVDTGNRITILHEDWTTLDVDERGWTSAFDFVIANMTPAVRTPECLLKLIRASRKSCLLKTWAVKRRSTVLDDLWRMFSGKEMTVRRAPFIYMFNAVYSMGFFPLLNFETVKWEHSRSVGDALEYYLSYMKGMFEFDESELRSRIAAYLDGIASDGMIAEMMTGRTVRMLWHVN